MWARVIALCSRQGREEGQHCRVGFVGVEVESEGVAVLVEALVRRIIQRGVPFEDCHDAGVIIVGQLRGEFTGFLDAEWTLGVREVQCPHPIVVAFFASARSSLVSPDL